jgi:hypothetical protein
MARWGVQMSLGVAFMVGGPVDGMFKDLDGRLQVGSRQMRHFEALDWYHSGGQAERGGEKRGGSEPCQDGGRSGTSRRTPPFLVLGLNRHPGQLASHPIACIELSANHLA